MLRQEALCDDDCYIIYASAHGKGIWRTPTLIQSGCDPTPFKCYPEVGIIDVSEEVVDMTIYPNPVQNNASIDLTLKERAFVSLIIVNTQGKIVLSKRF